jgi:hypothetical protein
MSNPYIKSIQSGNIPVTTAAANVSFNNAVASLPNSPTTTQTAIEQTVASIPTAIAANPPADIGRYQSEFGFSDAVFSNCVLNSSGSVVLDAVPGLKITQTTGDTTSNEIRGIQQIGQRYDGTFTAGISSIESVVLHAPNITGSPSSATLTIFDETDNVTLKSVSITYPTGSMTFVFNQSIVSGHVIQLRFSVTGDGSNFMKLQFNSSSVQNNAYLIYTANSWTSTLSYATNDLRVEELNCGTKSTSGTVAKTYTPADLDKWGNIKFTKTTPTNTTLTCDILPPTGNLASATFDIIGSSNVYGSNNLEAVKFIALMASSTSIKVNVTLSKLGSPPSNLMVHVYTSSGGNPSTSLGSVAVTASSITGTTNKDLDITLSSALVQGQTYFIVMTTANGDNGNKYIWSTNPLLSSGGNRYYSSNTGGSWTSDPTYGFTFSVTDNAVLKSNVASLSILSDINISTYTSIRARWNLSRTSTTDSTPILSNTSVTWEGSSSTWSIISKTTISTPTAQVNITVPTGYSQLELTIEDILGDSANATVMLRLNSDSGSNYAYSVNVSTGSGGSSSSASTLQLGSGQSLISTTNKLTGFIRFTNGTNTMKGIGWSLGTIGTQNPTGSGSWKNSSEINTISIYPGSNNITSGKFTLRGLK